MLGITTWPSTFVIKQQVGDVFLNWVILDCLCSFKNFLNAYGSVKLNAFKRVYNIYIKSLQLNFKLAKDQIDYELLYAHLCQIEPKAQIPSPETLSKYGTTFNDLTQVPGLIEYPLPAFLTTSITLTSPLYCSYIRKVNAHATKKSECMTLDELNLGEFWVLGLEMLDSLHHFSHYLQDTILTKHALPPTLAVQLLPCSQV